MMTRRRFLRGSALGLTVAGSAAVGYGFWEAAHIRIERETVPVPNLPPAFAGKTVAVLADLHHGPLVGIDFIRSAVEITNALAPDIIALVGDYAHKGAQAHEELPPCLEALSALKAPMGVFAVPGNHDMPQGGKLYRKLIAGTTLTDLTNQNRKLTIGNESLYVAGVDDLWWGRPNVYDALIGIPLGEPVILLSHNPDFAEDSPDARVGLMLSGHTHGGQIYVPGVGASWVPSKYGMKYRRGFVRGPKSNVFVSRGLGEAGVPIRLNVPPEINLLMLAAGRTTPWRTTSSEKRAANP